MKILITGAGGLVGRALSEHCRARGDEVFDYDHQSLDIADPQKVDKVVTERRPDAVINCAAWTDVDGCESDPEKARNVNALGPENLARATRLVDALLITISTDYVFDGQKNDFYTQRDTPRPISVYGRAKLEGERLAQAENARTIVVRTGYIFGIGGTNFLSTVVTRARRGDRLKVISDCYGTPTYGRDLAARLRELAIIDLPGVYHVVNSGEGASFEVFTREALRLANHPAKMLESVSMDSLPRPAPRPRDSRLKCLLSPAIGLLSLRTWQEGLADFVAEIQQEP
ncbi:MAG TPA: dTDP-4-dehydrorhamnose reductase [Pyrinomonadaceae bacterium]|nr:dTDP-4-dehydrorhamnose reductase [Pyrinomonadaceae bacterium]